AGPLRGQLEVRVVREGQLAVDRKPPERRRTDIEQHVLVPCDDDLVSCGRHLAVRPRGRVGPQRRAGRRWCRFLRMSDSDYSAEKGCREEKWKKGRAVLLSHDVEPPT